MQTAPGDLLVGRLLEGRYRILDRIARGGMSTVYAAVDERLDRLVAVKVMSSALSSDPKFGDRFAREARAAAKLTHVNAVAVYDQGHDTSDGGHHVFLVMELVDGRTLRDLIRERNGRFTPAEAISVMEPVLAALAAAHRAGLVHRDVKPENILLSDAGVVKVADFGLARAVDTDASATRTGLMMGTVAYCAPEQISRGHADARSDVYAAGIVLFELLTGQPPYQGETAMNVAWQHVHSRVPAPSSRLKSEGGIPTEIDELVVSATDSDPSGRPSDGASFLAEVADVRALLGLPVSAIPARPRAAGIDPRESRARATTDVLGHGGHAPHDTEVVEHRRGPAPGAPTVRPAAAGRRDEPPPPVVIPPRQPRSAKSRRRRRAWIALAIVLVVAAASVFGGMALTHWYQRWNSHVPKLAGQTVAAARQTIARDHYSLGRVDMRFSNTVDRDVVISSDPDDGARLEQGKSIDLVVSLGEDLVTVPAVYGLSLEEARTALLARGIQLDIGHSHSYYSNTVAKDHIISVWPKATKQVKRNSSVTVAISRGKHLVQVPGVGAQTSGDDGENLLKSANFKVERDFAYSDTVAKGDVIAFSPTGAQLYGSTVTETVSRGPEFVAMPEISPGTPFTDAWRQLRELGLHVRRQVYLGNGSQNLVVGTDPAAGKMVHVGATVVLTVI